MSTILQIRIEDKLEHTSGRAYEDPERRMIFHRYPGPDRPPHPPFILSLEYRPYVSGRDPWTTTAKGMLPVDRGSWELMVDEAPVNPGVIWIRDETSVFLILSFPWPRLDNAFPGFDDWPDPPVQQGYKGEGWRTRQTTGAINSSFMWYCDDVI